MKITLPWSDEELVRIQAETVILIPERRSVKEKRLSWKPADAVFQQRAERLKNLRANMCNGGKILEDLLLETTLGSELCQGIAAMLAAFAEPNVATVEDLRVLDVRQPNWEGLYDALYYDEYYSDDSNFALIGFKHSVVSSELWLSFLLEISKTKTEDFIELFTNRTKARSVLFPVEVWEPIFLSQETNRNVLGHSATIDLEKGSDFVAQLQNFVTPALFCKLTTARQRNGSLPLHFALAICARSGLDIPSPDFLRTLLPNDETLAKTMDLDFIEAKTGRHWSLPEFTRKRFRYAGSVRLTQAVAVATALLDTLRRGI